MNKDRNHNLFSPDFRMVYRSSYDGAPNNISFSSSVSSYLKNDADVMHKEMNNILEGTPIFHLKYKECRIFKKLREGQIVFCNCVECKRLSEDRKGYMINDI